MPALHVPGTTLVLPLSTDIADLSYSSIRRRQSDTTPCAYGIMFTHLVTTDVCFFTYGAHSHASRGTTPVCVCSPPRPDNHSYGPYKPSGSPEGTQEQERRCSTFVKQRCRKQLHDPWGLGFDIHLCKTNKVTWLQRQQPVERLRSSLRNQKRGDRARGNYHSS